MEADKAIKIVEQMIGGTYEYEGKKHLIYDARVKGNVISLITDKDVIELPIDGIEDYLPDFKFVKLNQLVRQPEIIEMVTNGSSMYSQVQSTLLDTIKKVQDNPAYIEQAQAINDTIKTVIDLEKVKIQTIQLLK